VQAKDLTAEVDPIPDPWVNHCELVTSKSSQDDKNQNVCSAEVAEFAEVKAEKLASGERQLM